MANVLKPDICVIGAGSGGLSVAAAAAAFGVPVVLIEKGRMGGDCLNYGCVPSKALIAAGKHADALRHGAGFGIADVDPDIDFSEGQRARPAASSRRSRPMIQPSASRALGVHVIKAEARFKDKRTRHCRRCRDPRPPLRRSPPARRRSCRRSKASTRSSSSPTRRSSS